MKLQPQMEALCATNNACSKKFVRAVIKMIIRNSDCMRVVTDQHGYIGESISIVIVDEKSIYELRDLMNQAFDFKFTVLQNDTLLCKSLVSNWSLSLCLTFTRVHPNDVNDYMNRNSCVLIKLNEDYSYDYFIGSLMREKKSKIIEDIAKCAYHPDFIEKWIEEDNDLELYEPQSITPSNIRTIIS